MRVYEQILVGLNAVQESLFSELEGFEKEAEHIKEVFGSASYTPYLSLPPRSGKQDAKIPSPATVFFSLVNADVEKRAKETIERFKTNRENFTLYFLLKNNEYRFLSQGGLKLLAFSALRVLQREKHVFTFEAPVLLASGFLLGLTQIYKNNPQVLSGPLMTLAAFNIGYAVTIDAAFQKFNIPPTPGLKGKLLRSETEEFALQVLLHKLIIPWGAFLSGLIRPLLEWIYPKNIELDVRTIKAAPLTAAVVGLLLGYAAAAGLIIALGKIAPEFSVRLRTAEKTGQNTALLRILSVLTRQKIDEKAKVIYRMPLIHLIGQLAVIYMTIVIAVKVAGGRADKLNRAGERFVQLLIKTLSKHGKNPYVERLVTTLAGVLFKPQKELLNKVQRYLKKGGRTSKVLHFQAVFTPDKIKGLSSAVSPDIRRIVLAVYEEYRKALQLRPDDPILKNYVEVEFSFVKTKRVPPGKFELNGITLGNTVKIFIFFPTKGLGSIKDYDCFINTVKGVFLHELGHVILRSFFKAITLVVLFPMAAFFGGSLVTKLSPYALAVLGAALLQFVAVVGRNDEWSADVIAAQINPEAAKCLAKFLNRLVHVTETLWEEEHGPARHRVYHLIMKIASELKKNSPS